LNNIYKILFSSLIIVGVIVGSVLFSTNSLKEEVIKTHLTLSKLHVNIFAEQLAQTLHTLEQTVDNLSFAINQKDINTIEENFEPILAKDSYIRSINIIENGVILYSSNVNNKGMKVNLSEYYPIPMFDTTILRFGTLHHGRDISQKDPLLHYLPIIKKIETSTQKTYQILITLNLDELHNQSFSDISSDLEILRIDGELLYATNNQQYKNKHEIQTSLYQEAIKKTLSWGVETIENKEYLSAYQLTQVYPLMVSIKSDYEKTLQEWEKKRLYILLILAVIVLVFIVLAITLVVKHDHSRKEEIRYQKETLENKKKFEIIFEQQNFLASILDRDGTINQINHIFVEFLKEEDVTIVGKKLYELSCWDEEDKNWIIFNIKNYLEASSVTRELKAKDKNNNIHFIELIITSVEYEDNFNLVVIGTDITQDKLKEEKLQNAYTVFNNTNDGILITDKDIKIVDVNNAFTVNTGYTLEDVIGKSPNILKSHRHDSIFYKEMWEALEKENFWNGEIVNKRSDGVFYIELLTINKIVGQDGELKNYIAVFTNITKEKDQEELLKKKEQMLFQQSKMASMGEMLENIAHQWRQPLTVVSAAASAIQVKKELDILKEEFLDESLQLIVSSTQHLSKTIDDFRNFFRQDKEKVKFLLSDCIEKSLSIVSSKFVSRGIKLEKNFTDITILGFQNELVQVIMNILNNARDALESIEENDRMIFISTNTKGNNAVLVITDTAGGIKDDILDKIFEPYFTTKHQSQGTGIGLYMSREIITKHIKGTLIAENKTFTHNKKSYTGASFVISIPMT
jgi:PAS domain S-box-containing protein